MPHGVLDIDGARHTPHVARKRRVRIREILRVALELAAEEGRDALTLKRLAERLGLTTGALYRYFASKDALVAELQHAVIQSLARTTRVCVDEAESHADEAGLSEADRALLAVAVSALVFERFSRDAPVEFGILSMHLSSPEYALPDREAAHVFEAAWSALSDLANRLRDAEERGALEPADASERALGLWAGLQGVAQTRKLSRGASVPIDSMRISRGLIAALLVGWGADADRTNRLLELAERERFADSSRATNDFLGEFDDESPRGAAGRHLRVSTDAGGSE